MTTKLTASEPILVYLDLLGMSYLARTNGNEFNGKLQALRQGLISSCIELESSARIIFLHTSAYVCSDDPQRLIAFLRSLRSFLLSQAVFLQAVVTRGSIPQQVEVKISEPDGKMTRELRASLNHKKNVFSGFSLGSGTAQAFSDHYKFAGIGVRVDRSILGADQFTKNVSSEELITSFVLNNRSRAIEQYTDISFTSNDLEVNRLENVCHEYVRLRSRFRSIGTHFLPLFLTMIRSADWNNLSEERASGRASESFASQMFARMIGPWYTKHFSDVPYKEYLIYALIDAVHHSCGAESSEFKIAASRGSVEQYFRKLEEVPDSILSVEAREDLLKSMAPGGRHTSV